MLKKRNAGEEAEEAPAEGEAALDADVVPLAASEVERNQGK